MVSCWITWAKIFQVSAAAYIASDPNHIPVTNHRFASAAQQAFEKMFDILQSESETF